jgi:hypothetical protein
MTNAAVVVEHPPGNVQGVKITEGVKLAGQKAFATSESGLQDQAACLCRSINYV